MGQKQSSPRRDEHGSLQRRKGAKDRRGGKENGTPGQPRGPASGRKLGALIPDSKSVEALLALVSRRMDTLSPVLISAALRRLAVRGRHYSAYKEYISSTVCLPFMSSNPMYCYMPLLHPPPGAADAADQRRRL